MLMLENEAAAVHPGNRHLIREPLLFREAHPVRMVRLLLLLTRRALGSIKETLDRLQVVASNSRLLSDKNPLSHHHLGHKQVQLDPILRRRRRRQDRQVMAVRLFLQALGSMRDMVTSGEDREVAEGLAAQTLDPPQAVANVSRLPLLHRHLRNKSPLRRVEQ
jgi:hypothetical protein